MGNVTTGATQPSETPSQEVQAQPESKGIGSPISNEAYNIISTLHKKCEGLEAYRKYACDADAPFWKQMSEAEISCVEKLVQKLEELVKEGKLRMQEPGAAAQH